MIGILKIFNHPKKRKIMRMSLKWRIKIDLQMISKSGSLMIWSLFQIRGICHFQTNLDFAGFTSEWCENIHYFHWKIKDNINDRSYEKLHLELEESGIFIESLWSIYHHLEKLLRIHTVDYDRCINNCMIFVGIENPQFGQCPYCNQLWYDELDEYQGDLIIISSGHPILTSKVVYTYIPIIPRLKLLYSNPIYIKKMCYPRTELWSKSWEGVRDIWDGIALRYYRLQEDTPFFLFSW